MIAVRDAAAAMRGDAGGLVDDDQVLVLEQDRRHQGRGKGRRRSIARLRRSHGRDADVVAGLNPVVRRHAGLVDAHLAAANDAVDMALGHAPGESEQEVVEALAGVLGVDPKVAGAVGRHGATPRVSPRLQANTAGCLPLSCFTGRVHLAYT